MRSIKNNLEASAKFLTRCKKKKDFMEYFLIFEKNLHRRLSPIKKYIKRRDEERHDHFIASRTDITAIWNDMMDIYKSHNYRYKSVLYNNKTYLSPIGLTKDILDCMFYSHNHNDIEVDCDSIEKLKEQYLFVHEIIKNFIKKHPEHVDFIKKHFIVNYDNSEKPIVFKSNNLILLMISNDHIIHDGIKESYDYIIEILKKIFIKLHYKYLEDQIWHKYSKKELSISFLKNHISEICKEIMELKNIFPKNDYKPFSMYPLSYEISKCFQDKYQNMY